MTDPEDHDRAVHRKELIESLWSDYVSIREGKLCSDEDCHDPGQDEKP